MIFILIIDFAERLYLIKLKRKFISKTYFAKKSALLLILLINSNKRINEHKNGFQNLRSADTSDFLSLKRLSLKNYNTRTIRHMKIKKTLNPFCHKYFR